ncbi:arylsulfatase [Dyadobacter sp. CY261]|uniref:arylsulfatase n=1 Tax=Dyadobacter sp. CY261 TaxID=2907203 RepID=UPI001F466443|nr:arylsulfatase [Dyadobacter sp. CY261]MCF0074087.1 arylsulfatase [Dyadobacter sp. CY261]
MNKQLITILALSLITICGPSSMVHGQRPGANSQQTIGRQRSAVGGHPPNILLIMTDDQGYGDFGFTGNPHVKTPNIDQLAARSTRLTNFHNSPVCAPTRASLLTGRYHQRTGVHDTYNGGAIMAAEETTLAEILSKNGYKTGIVGKWHLGDNYPFRPSDQGFQYSLIHGGGGVGQPGDFYENFVRTDSSYFNTTLAENDRKVKRQGYCSDIFTDQALEFLREKRSAPFFLYVSYNAPHTPLQLPKKYEDMYKDLAFDTETDRQQDKAWAKMTDKDKADARKVYGMATNIDDNVGRILAELKKQGLEENTIVIFVTDNGNQQLRFNAGFRGLKGSAWEGGTRVPFLISGAGLFEADKEVNALTAHIDVLPTVLEAVKVPLPANLKTDGRSVLKTIQGKLAPSPRTFYNAWNRGWPEPYRNAAFYRNNFKLVAFNADGDDLHTFGLFDMDKDPFEQNNLVQSQPALARQLKKELDSIFTDISNSPNLTPRRIIVGSVHEPVSILTRQDLNGTSMGAWLSDKATGYWNITIARDGYYNLRSIHTSPIAKGTRSLVRVGHVQRSAVAKGDSNAVPIDKVWLKKGDYLVESWFEGQGGVTGPFYVEIAR